METMKSLRLWFALALCVSVAPLLPAKDLDWAKVSTTVANILERGHFSQQRLDDTISKRTLENYLSELDHSRLYFTEADVARFERMFGTRLDDAVEEGDLGPAREIFELYKQRVAQRVKKINLLLDNRKFSFDSDRTTEITREEADWPANEEAADRLWHDMIEHQLLTEELKETAEQTPGRTPVEVVRKRYERLLRSVNELEQEDVTQKFLSALAQAYDPHSEYLSPSQLENFEISMRNSLVGIGAVLRSEDGYARIMELVQGGPAAAGGKLRVKDRVTAVAQGKDGEFVDVIDMKLDKVVEMIRGKKNTLVRLEVIPATSTDLSQREIIDIVRDEITLKDSLAKGQLIETIRADGTPMRLGWIVLPSFYKDMSSQAADARSTTTDVAAILERLKAEEIEGLVVDLRGNGGGSLDEAVDLTGLFIKSGPVVQALNTEGISQVSRDRNPRILYDGPMVVLTSRISASASEIFAAALQDYGRALVIGEAHTYGKGTVQTMIDIGRYLSSPLAFKATNAGALKLTVQKFYRIAGGSTQLKGVESDILLPSPLESVDVGEVKMKHALPYDTTTPLEYETVPNAFPVEELQSRSLARIAQEPEFQYMQADAAEMKALLEKNERPLNAELLKTEQEEKKARDEARKQERLSRRPDLPKVYRVSLDDVTARELEVISFRDSDNGSETYVGNGELTGGDDADSGEEDDKGASPLFDPVKLETLNILADLVTLVERGRTAKTE